VSVLPSSRNWSSQRLLGRLRRESGLVALAVGTIALHVLDDNFFQPQSGTSAADHLVSGLVPFAALVLAVVAYPRLRAGFRAGIALTLGLFGIVAGVEGAYYALKVGAAGDDYTSLLAIPAGLLLIGVGISTLWRSRRTNDSLRRRYPRRLLLTLASAAGAYVVLFPLSIAYVVTHTARASVPAAHLGAAHEQVSFTTSDGLRLQGWYVPSKNGAAVIAFPGRSGTQKQARMLARHGYGVLLFDRRGEGESEGDPNIFGWSGERDVNAAVAFLQRRPDVDRDRIGGIGLSVGGEMLLEAAAESDGLKAVVSDGAGSRSIREDLARPGSGKWGEIPPTAVITAATAIFSNQAPPPNLKQLVARIAPRSVFFVYGGHDQPNVLELDPVYYNAASEPKAIWKIPGASHTGGIDARPREYERRIITFFDRALPES
jgi:dienelactone hydrolase